MPLTMRILFRPKLLLSLCVLFIITVFVHQRTSDIFTSMDKCHLGPMEKLSVEEPIDHYLDLWSREDVLTCTHWGAPIVWEEMFNPKLHDKYHIQMGTSVALTVFAVGRYLQVYLPDFLISAENHFMVALPVTYYVFTDTPMLVPKIRLAQGRKLEVVKVEKHSRWQDISMQRMRTIADIIQSRLRLHHKYVFCFDVDQVFANRFGTEALADSVAVLHAFFYRSPKREFIYERDPHSAAYMETGDFYYHAAVFGGTWQSVKNITEICYRGIAADRAQQVEVTQQVESHLNKYFWINKPSKVLSPEYCWSWNVGYRREVHVHRLLWADKHYKTEYINLV